MKKLLLTLAVLTVLTISATAISQPLQKDNSNINVEAKESSFLDSLTNNLLSITLSYDQVNRGDYVSSEIFGQVNAVEDPTDSSETSPTCNGDDVELMVQWYGPNGDYKAGDYVTGVDECQYYSALYDFTVWDDAELGDWTVDVEYRHEDSGDLTGSSVYDFGSDTYEVVSTGDSGDDSTTPQEPQIDTYRSTDVEVSNGQITTTVYLENDGGGMQEERLIELDPRQQTLFSFISSQDTCDPDNEKAVNKEYSLKSGERESITLTSEVPDGNYDVTMISATGCANLDSSVTSTEPFGWGTVVENVDVGTREPSLVTYRSTDVEVRGDNIVSTVYLANEGGPMQDEIIVEQQPVLTNELSWWDNLLSSVSQSQFTCDPDSPENVHKTVKLGAGETAKVPLESTGMDAGDYDVKLVSATGCSTDDPSVTSTEPFGWSSIVDNVRVEPDVPEIVEYKKPSVSVNNETNEVTGTVYFRNNGSAPTGQSLMVEMQVLDSQGNILSFVTEEQGTCDNDSLSVNKKFKLGPAEKLDIDLTTEVPENGEYKVRFVTASGCMTDGEGVFVDPYRPGSQPELSVSVGSTGGGNGLPVNLLLLVAGLLLIGVAVVVYRG